MTIYPQLDIPETLAAGPGPGNTDPRVLERFAKTGVADHMQKDVLRGMLEAKEMLRELWGTKNVYTYGVAGTGHAISVDVLGAPQLAQHLLGLEHAAEHVFLHVIGDASFGEAFEHTWIGVPRPWASGQSFGDIKLRIDCHEEHPLG